MLFDPFGITVFQQGKGPRSLNGGMAWIDTSSKLHDSATPSVPGKIP